ncbi:Lar family restriction alleviation protein [Pseudomonas mendocina]|nr:Lar family restriction alleviation protein [Pseudomonas mendocina]MDV5861341.1 Lar family restriction alleviation protein [Pseudomonas mendocina]
MSSEELKPCPFCGTSDLLGFEPSYEGGWTIVKCRKCGCSGPTGRSESEHDAIAWWNARAQLAAIQGGMGDEPLVVATAILGGLFHGGSGPELGDIDVEVCTPHLEKIQCETVNSSDDVFLPLMTVAQHERIVAALSAQQSDPWEPSGADYDRAIHRNPDAKAWADFFVSTFPGLADKHELMIGWFANAMMAIHDHLKAQQSAQDDEYPPCDYCGVVPDYHPWHGSGAFLDVENPHIHACNDCRHLLPTAQSAPERVSVPVELLERLETWVTDDCSALEELRALLAQRERGGA